MARHGLRHRWVWTWRRLTEHWQPIRHCRICGVVEEARRTKHGHAWRFTLDGIEAGPKPPCPPNAYVDAREP